MRPLLLCFVTLALSACEPADACRSLEPGQAAGSLPLRPYGLGGQAGTFDRAFLNSVQKGPPGYRCCFGFSRGESLSGCHPLDCAGFEAEASSVGAPYSGPMGNGEFFCQVAVKDAHVVSVWGQYND